MNVLLAVPFAFALILSGCSSPARDDMDAASRDAASEPAHVAPLKPDAQFCQSAAQGQVSDSFDDATRARMVAGYYRQCMEIHAAGETGPRIAGMGTLSY